jgi:hypothetical protein
MSTLPIRAALVALVVSFFAAPARAEHPFELSAFAGWHLISERNGLGVHEGDVQPSLEDGIGFGVRVGWGLFKRLQLEGEIVFFPSKTENAPMPADPAMIIGWRVGAIYRFLTPDTRTRGTFFVSGGIAEHAVESSDRGTLIEEIDWSPYFGLGAAVHIGANWGFRFDGKLFLVPASDSDGRVPEFEIVAGLFRTFGEKAKKAEPPKPEPPKPDEPPPEPPKPEEPPPTPPADADGDGILDQ